MKKGAVTGLFIIMDTYNKTYKEKVTSYHGIYLCDQLHNLVNDGKSLCLFRGNRDIAIKNNIRVSNDWQDLFSVHNFLAGSNYNCFNCPIQVAKILQNSTSELSGYWSKPFKLNDNINTIDIITYSVPIIDFQGNVYGTIGIDISLDVLTSLLNYKELDTIYGNNSSSYFIAWHNTSYERLTFSPIAISGNSINLSATQIPDLEAKSQKHENIYSLKNTMLFGKEQLACITQLPIYQKKAFYENQEWVLIGIVSKKAFLTFTLRPLRPFIESLIIVFILFFLGV